RGSGSGGCGGVLGSLVWVSGEAIVKPAERFCFASGSLGNLTSNAVLVSGAGRAMGKAAIECLAQDGAALAINYRISAAEAEQLIAELEKNR
ncbi:hypothetical protein ACWERA_59030, partial [Streptomyces mirabilis]